MNPNNKITEILTPVGRLVAGSCFEPQTMDAEGKPLLVKNGPNAGQPRVEYFMAIAVPKTDPGFAEICGKILAEARASFPSLFDPAGNCISPKFAFKIVDGDSIVPNSRGSRPCDKEGYPGNYVMHFSGGYAPKCYSEGGKTIITNPDEIKRGYYVRIYGTCRGNGSQQQPGIYLNHSMVEMVAYGKEIISGPSGEAVFGAAPIRSTLPPGASSIPFAPATPLATPGAAPATPSFAPPAAGAPIQPAFNFLNPPAGAVVAPAPLAPPPAMAAPAPMAPPSSAPVPEMKFVTADGGKWTMAQLQAAGYTEAQVLALPRG